MKSATLVVLGLALVVSLASATLLVPSTHELYPSRAVPRQWTQVNTSVNPAEPVRLIVGLRRRNADLLDRTFWDVSTPSSRNYARHLSHEQMRSLISPGAEAVRNVVQWLQQYGAAHVAVSAHEDSVSATLPLSQVERMLNVTFRSYHHNHTNHTIARAVDAVRIPARLASIVEVVGGHAGFPLESTSPLRSSQTRVTPAVLREAYGVTATAAPSGKHNIQSFFQAQAQYVSLTDMTEFCQKFGGDSSSNGSSVCTIARFIGPNNVRSPGDESSLDSEYITAMGNTETWVWSYSSNDFCADLLNWAQDVFSNTTGAYPYVISMSYGAQTLPNICEGPDVARLSQDVQKMGTMGISVIIASGDSGAGTTFTGGKPELVPSFPASIPYCTSVGGTTFVSGNSGEEEATTQFGSGGGFSRDFTAPDYQTSAIAAYFKEQRSTLPPTSSYPAGGRGTPDVSTLAEGFMIVSNGQTGSVMGTSASTPTFAGIVTLLNNERLQAGHTLGFLNPLLYSNPTAFTDIVKGDNKVDGYGWNAAAGWDAATGLGTPKFSELLKIVQGLNALDAKRAH